MDTFANSEYPEENNPAPEASFDAPQEPQNRVPLATRRHAPLPARSRDRSDIRGLWARGSSVLNVIHLNTSVGSK